MTIALTRLARILRNGPSYPSNYRLIQCVPIIRDTLNLWRLCIGLATTTATITARTDLLAAGHVQAVIDVVVLVPSIDSILRHYERMHKRIICARMLVVELWCG